MHDNNTIRVFNCFDTYVEYTLGEFRDFILNTEDLENESLKKENADLLEGIEQLKRQRSRLEESVSETRLYKENKRLEKENEELKKEVKNLNEKTKFINEVCDESNILKRENGDIKGIVRSQEDIIDRLERKIIMLESDKKILMNRASECLAQTKYDSELIELLKEESEIIRKYNGEISNIMGINK